MKEISAPSSFQRAVVGGGHLQPVFSGREPVQRHVILVSQSLPILIQSFQPVCVADFLRRAVAEGGETDADVPLPPGEGDVLLPLCQEDVLGSVLAAGQESGEENRRRNVVLPDAPGIERDESFGGAQIEGPILGGETGRGGELPDPDSVIGAELLQSSVLRAEMDDGGRTGEPERIPVLDDVSDVHVRDDRRDLSVLQEGQSFLGAGIDAVRGRQQIMDLVGGEPARAGRPFRPGAVGRPLQEAVLGGGEPEGTGIILRDIPDPGIRIPFFDKAVRGRSVEGSKRHALLWVPTQKFPPPSTNRA